MEKFEPKAKVGDILSNNDLHTIFGVGDMGGMRRSKNNNLLLIVSDQYIAEYAKKRAKRICQLCVPIVIERYM